jgi:hypothetical protein
MNTMDDRETIVHLDDPRCADLVLGLVPEGERAEDLAHAATCAECEQRLRAHVGAAHRASADVPSRRRAAAAPIQGPWTRRVVTWIAAAAALVAVTAVPLLRSGHHAPIPIVPLPTPGEAVSTREGAPEDPHLAEGLAAYRAHDLVTADRELTQAQAAGSAEQLRRVYLADVRLQRGDSRGALALLRSLRWLEVPEPWRRNAATMLVQALRQQGEGASADSIERALKATDPGTPFVP